MADDVLGSVPGSGRRGERATGTPNTIYNLSSVLFHTLEGAASYDTYIEDAQREDDQELVEFFQRVREEDRDRANEAQLLLAERTHSAIGGQRIGPGIDKTDGSVTAGSISGRGSAREEDKGLLQRAKEAITGEEEPRREDSRDWRRDDPLAGRP